MLYLACSVSLFFFASNLWAASSCEESPPETKSVFCSSENNKALFSKMESAFNELVSSAPGFEVPALKAEQSEFIETETRSCATNGGPAAIAECAKRRMQERTELIHFRATTPAVVAAPQVPEGSFLSYCNTVIKETSPRQQAITFLQAAAGVSNCEELDKVRPKLITFNAFHLVSAMSDAAQEKLLGEGIGTLEPFAYFPNLMEIALPYGSPVQDLKPIQNLTLLRRLSLSASKIGNLEVLKGLKNLEEIDVRTTKVTDISPLMELPRLRSLDIRNIKLPKAQVAQLKKKHPAIELH